jgi:hypothetical protein
MTVLRNSPIVVVGAVIAPGHDQHSVPVSDFIGAEQQLR